MRAHVREWELRRLSAGELEGAEAESLRAHLAGCAECQLIERDLAAERAQFEAALPFEAFADGVERRARAPQRQRRTAARRWAQGVAAIAACALVGVIAPRLMATAGPDGIAPVHGRNRLKGGAEVELRIAGAHDGPQRVASERGDEALGPGERVRIGYRAGAHRYVAAVSVDAQGNVSALYPESGQSLPAQATPQLSWLPGSLEFTGHGRERVFVVLSDQPLAVDALEAAARTAYARAGGDVTRIGRLDVPGEQFQRTLLKP